MRLEKVMVELKTQKGGINMQKCKECGQEVEEEKSLKQELRECRYFLKDITCDEIIKIARQHENKRYLKVFDEANKEATKALDWKNHIDYIRQAIVEAGEVK